MAEMLNFIIILYTREEVVPKIFNFVLILNFEPNPKN